MKREENLAELLGVAPAWIDAARRCGFAGFLSSQDHFTIDLLENPNSRETSKLTGIYFWIAENGEGYIGQAVDIRKRLKTHYKMNPDLVAAAYLRCDAENLDSEERSLIALLENSFALRNVLLVRQSARYRPLDDIVAPSVQEGFPQTGNPKGWHSGARRNFPILERRQKQRLRRLMSDPERMEMGQIVVTCFVDACIPDPYRTEHRFWSVTGFDKGNLIARLNVGVQEVVTVHECGTVRLLCPEKLAWWPSRPLYRSGARAHVLTFEKYADILEKQTALVALRRHVQSLMRHTTSLNARSHLPAMLQPELLTEAHDAA